MSSARESPPQEHAPTAPLRKNRDFLKLWTGAGMSILGARVSAVAYPLLMVWQNGSPVDAGLVGFAALLPVLLVQLPAGVLVDRWDRRRTMIVCDLVGILAMGSVGITLLAGDVGLPHLMAAAFVEGGAAIFYRLSERAAVRNVVHADHLSAALSQNEARGRAAGLVGQPLGSSLFAVFRGFPFLFTAIAHLFALVMLLLIKQDLQTRRTAPPRRLHTELMEGLNWLRRQRFLRAAVLLVGATNILFQVLSLALVLVIKDSGGSPAVIGVIGAVSGVGGVCGALSGSWFGRRFAVSTIVMGVFAAWTVLMPMVALTSNPFALGALFAGMTFGGALMNVVAGVYQVQLTPDELQGRVSSVAMLLSSGANSLGALAGGFLLGAFSTTATVLGVGATMLVTLVASLLSPAMRSAPTEPVMVSTPREPRKAAAHSPDSEEI
ncbi:MFS transporter [Streptomyces sp. DH8]|uniref:MFS transporter n=1 Tax=Streptomyces sp. DH8 TaxID=2857008 RepID=UPI001E44D581|nr:MFS transporter [Streptomyces sp. DH8]